MCKPLHPGKAAMNGLLAALLAREGFTGPTGILDERSGLPGTFVGVTDLTPALEDLGTRFEILDNSTKLYAACHLLHATIDAGRAIRARAAPAPDAIAAVECHVHPLAVKVAAIPEPRTGLEAKFSAAYCAALALTRGDAGESEFADAAAADPGLPALAGRIRPCGRSRPRHPRGADAGPAARRPRARRGRAGRPRHPGPPGVPAGRGGASSAGSRASSCRRRRSAGSSRALRHLPALPDVGTLAALTCKGDQP